MSRKLNDEAAALFRRQIGARIWALREALGIGKAVFAQQIGASQSNFSKWETGAGFPRELAIQTLCVKFEVDFNYIYMGTFRGVRDGDLVAQLVPLIAARLSDIEGTG